MKKVVFIFVAVLVVGAASVFAAPTLTVTPGTIAHDYTGTVQVDITGLLGASPETILRLYVDEDGNGVIDAEDYVVWTDLIKDNTAEWSPNQFSDVDGLVGDIQVDVRLFTPIIHHSYTIGNFIWEAEDIFDASTDISSFTITQAADIQSVSGTVSDSFSSLPLGGAAVVLVPISEFCEGPPVLALTDTNGDYTLYLPAALDCSHYIVLAIKPGYLSSFLNQPYLVFTGADNFTNQDFQITPGDYTVTGTLTYETGIDVGEGIPGASIWVDFDGGPPLFTVAITDENGDYSVSLIDGDWFAGLDGEDELAIQGAIARENTGVSVTVSGGPNAFPGIMAPAANAYINGTVLDETFTPVPNAWIQGMRNQPCDPDCYQTIIHSRSDGTFTLGVVGPTGPATYDYGISQEVNLPDGLIVRSELVVAVSDTDVTNNHDVNYLTPTNTINGSFLDKDKNPVENLCLTASTTDATYRYDAHTTTDCTGDFSLPVRDGTWFIQHAAEDGALGFYRNLDEVDAHRNITVSGSDVNNALFIVGSWIHGPTLDKAWRSSGVIGDQVFLFGHGFSYGGFPDVFFDATAANVVAFRSDLGMIVVDVPGTLIPADYSITVYSPGLDMTSNALCFTVEPGIFTPACTFSGLAMDPGFAGVQSALVVALEPGSTDDYVRVAVTNGSGNWSIDLDTAGSYDLAFVPPQYYPWQWGGYPGETCPGVRNHVFSLGWSVTGQVQDDNSNSIPYVDVEARDFGSGFGAYTTTDDDGYFNFTLPTGTFDFDFFAPVGSRFVNNSYLSSVAVSSDTDVGTVTMPQGLYFCGTLLNINETGEFAAIDAYQNSLPTCFDTIDNDFDGLTDEEDECSYDVFFGSADTHPCTGQFDIALTANTNHRLDLDADFMNVDGPTEVRWINITSDTFSEFDFHVYESDGLQYTGPEPRIKFLFEGEYPQEGQPAPIGAENINGAVRDILFSDGIGGWVSGVDTKWDPSRNILITRIPPGTAAGEMKLQIDGVDSPPVPHMLQPGLFDTGTYTVSGTVDDGSNPVQGAIMILFWIDPASADCEDEGLMQDYAITDASGNYSMMHPGGDFMVILLPPDGSTLTSTADMFMSVFSSTTLDKTLAPGFAVHIRITDDEAIPNPLAQVEFEAEGDVTGVFDWKVTDANGDATLYLPADDYEFFLLSPFASRFPESTTVQTISAPLDFGDIQMQRGAFTGSRATEQDGTIVPGAIVYANDNVIYESLFETFADLNGLFHGPIPFSSDFNIHIEGPLDRLADFQSNDISMGANDRIAYPSRVLLPAGFIDGFVRDSVTTNPIADIGIHNHEDDGFPGNGSGWTKSCPNGYYRMKVPVGDHYIHVNAGSEIDPSYVESWYQDVLCSDDAITVSVTELGTTTADINLVPGGSISGNITGDGLPLVGVQIEVTAVSLGTCSISNFWTDSNGDFSIPLPAAADYQVRVNAGGYGFGVKCYDDIDNCTGFDPVTVTAGADTPNIDFDFGCASPADLLNEDFETGAPTWASSGLWHIASEPTCSPMAQSGSWGAYFGQDGSCHYDTTFTEQGMLTAPVMNAVPAGATLTYWSRRGADGNCGVSDRSFVWLWVNGGGPFQVWEECDNSQNWNYTRIDLTPWYSPGDDLQIEFEFDTVDNVNNWNLGWILDDVRIFTCPVPCTPLTDPTLVSVDAQACGGPILAASSTPTLLWSNVDDETDYDWEVYDGPGCTGSMVDSGTTGADVTTTITTALIDGSYSWRVMAVGDSVVFCDSNWVCGCEFTVNAGSPAGEPSGPGEAPMVVVNSSSGFDVEEQLDADTYNVYEGSFGTWYAFDNTGCWIVGVPSGPSRMAVDFSQLPGSHWYLVGASNTTGESAQIGQDDTSTPILGSCGANP